MAAAKKRCFFKISVFYWIFTSVIQSPRFTNDYEIGISVSTQGQRHGGGGDRPLKVSKNKH